MEQNVKVNGFGSKVLMLGMVVHGSGASLSRRRLGMTAQFTTTSVKMNPMEYTQSRCGEYV